MAILKAQSKEKAIARNIVNFLTWHKKSDADTMKENRQIIRYVSVNKNMVRRVMDKKSVEKYLAFYKKSGFLSDMFINNLRGYFYEIGITLAKSPLIKKGEIIKIQGLDIDEILQSDEPELLMDNIDKSHFKKIVVLSNKAIVQLYTPNSEITTVFTLTKVNDVWLIDYIGYG